MGQPTLKKKKWRFSEIDINDLNQVHAFFQDAKDEILEIRRKRMMLYFPSADELSDEDFRRKYAKMEKDAFFEDCGARTLLRYFAAQVFHKYMYIPKRSAVLMAKCLCDTLNDEDVLIRMKEMAEYYRKIYACVVNETEEDRKAFEELGGDDIGYYGEDPTDFFRNYK